MSTTSFSSFEALLDSLPNGLHDAELWNYEADVVSGTLRLRLDVWMGDADAEMEMYRAAELTFEGLTWFVVDPPDPRSMQKPYEPLVVDAGSGDPSTAPLQAKLPHASFRCWIFVRQWNAFMRLSARKVTFAWTADERLRK